MEQQTVTATLYLIGVFGILIYVGYLLYTHHLTKHGACWSLIISTIEDLSNHALDNQLILKQIQSHRCMADVVQDYINQYNGTTDLDAAFEQCNPDCDFFIGLRRYIKQHWNYLPLPPFNEVLESAIYAYNIDGNYHITLRQFMNHLCFVYKSYYTLNAKVYYE